MDRLNAVFKALPLPDGVTPISLLVSGLIGLLGVYTTSSVVAEQGAVVIAVTVALGTQALFALWRHRDPASIDALSSAPASAFRTRSYSRRRSVGDCSAEESLPARCNETNGFVELVTAADFRVGVMVGSPGAGKTSLVQAALLPSLEQSGWAIWHVPDPDSNPQRALIDAAVFAGAPLAAQQRDWDALRAALTAHASQAGLNGGAIVVCDAVEQLFHSGVDAAQRRAFWEWIVSAVGPRARVLLVTRPEYREQIEDEIRSASAGQVGVDRRELEGFDPVAAIGALNSLAAASGLALERRLSGEVVRQLLRRDRVSPALLQMVGTGLFEGQIKTLSAFSRAGGAVGLLRRFVDYALEDHASDDVSSGELRQLLRQIAASGREGAAAGDRMGSHALRAALDELVADGLIERSPAGTLRMADPLLATSVLAVDGTPHAALRQASGALAWVAHWQRGAMGGVGLLMLVVSTFVVGLIVLGYPEGRHVGTLDPQVGELLKSLDVVAFDAKGNYLAADIGSEIVVWDTQEQGAVVQRMAKPQADRHIVTTSLAFRGAKVWLYGARGEMWGWQLDTGELVVREPEPILAAEPDMRCGTSATAMNWSGSLLALGTNCGVIHVLDVESRTEYKRLDHEDASCVTSVMAFGRGGSHLLEFFRCNSQEKELARRNWPLKQAHADGDTFPPIAGALIKAGYDADDNLYVLRVTETETSLLQLAHQIARARWPIVIDDGAPADFAPDRRLLAVGSARSGILLYAPGVWPFEFVPVKGSASGLANLH